MSKKSLFVIVGCLLIVLSSILVGIFLSMKNDKIILTMSSPISDSLNKIEIQKGSTLSLDGYNQSEDGYEFLGWFTDKTFENKVDEKFIYTANKTIYAGFSKIVNVNEIDSLSLSNVNSYTIVSQSNTDVLDEKHINKLLSLGATRLDISRCQVNNQEIDSGMFQSSNIREILLGDNIFVIGENCFENCYNLKYVKFGDNIKTLKSGAFKNCRNIESIQLNSGLIEIQKDVFYGCSRIKELTIPSTVNNIFPNFISNTPKLKSINVHIDNENYTSVDGILYSRDYKTLIKCPENKTGQVSINSNVEVVEEYAFYKSLVSDIVFSVNLKELKDYSFYSNKNLTHIQLSSIYNYVIGNSVFENCDNIKNIQLGAGIQSIGNYTFKNNYNLKTIEIFEKNSLVSIGDNCFSNCEKLSGIEIPNSVTYLGLNNFYNCKNLSSAVIGDGITALENRLFYNCINLESVTILGEINTLGNSVFYNCENLKSIGNLDKVIESQSSVFYNCKSLNTMSLIKLKEVPNYMFFNCESLEYVNLLNSEKIGQNSFDGCTTLSIINIGDKLNSIENTSFLNSTNATLNIIGNKNFITENGLILSADKKTLYYINSNELINEVFLPQEVEIIYNNAFSGKTYITRIDVHESNKYFDSIDGILVSKDLTELIAYPSGNVKSELLIPESIKIIKKFSIDSENIKKLIIHDNVEIIEGNALSNLPNLESLTIPFIGTEKNPSAKKWVSVIFYDSNNNQSIQAINNGRYLPEKLKTINITSEIKIPSFAFYQASNIENIYINSEVTYISEYSFFGCSRLKNIEFDGKIQYIGSYAFDKCSNVKKIIIGYDSNLVVSKNALASLSKSISVYVIYDPSTIIDLTAKKSYKNKFFSVLVGSNQWIWYFSSQGE